MKKSFALVFTNIILFFLIGCSATPVAKQKINGVSFVSSRDTLLQTHIDPVLRIQASHAAVMPFAFVRDKNNPELLFNTERQWYGERYQGAKQYIESLHASKIKVMLKPHIWIWKGVFTGDMHMNTEEEWLVFEKSYEEYILLYAQLAQDTGVELFCVGTELYNFTNERHQFWDQLISKVRNVYTGKITYAENWDKVDKVHFWQELDYIGADAYFPISEQKTPSVAEAREGWQVHKKLLKELAEKYNRPVLFTEFGYRSADYSGKEPWASDRHDGAMNSESQKNLYEATFEEFWDEPWFAGGFVWKWFHDHKRSASEENNRFTPQGKPAEEVLLKWYSRM
tara:strand:- start:340 stop:1359 length:1020 start_codon:yes stop_codon:yes gene_type:complete